MKNPYGQRVAAGMEPVSTVVREMQVWKSIVFGYTFGERVPVCVHGAVNKIIQYVGCILHCILPT